MARKVEVTLVDDIDGSTADRTVEFSLDSNSYEIDLSDANAEKLEAALAPFVEQARKVRGGRRKPGRPARGGQGPGSSDVPPQAVRAWAEQQGIKVSGRGRIPREVLDAYAAAH